VLQVSQLAQEERAERVPIGAFVDREQRDELVGLARQSDCSVSRIVRRAIARELERSEGVGGLSFSLPPASRTERREASEPVGQSDSRRPAGQQ
jgi:hypothetical protein